MTPRTPAKYCARLQSTATQRSRHCQVWRWLSTKPGMTIMPVPSMMSASTRPIPGLTSAMCLPSSNMSPPRRSPIVGSMVMIVAFLIRIRCMSPLLTVEPGCRHLEVASIDFRRYGTSSPIRGFDGTVSAKRPQPGELKGTPPAPGWVLHPRLRTKAGSCAAPARRRSALERHRNRPHWCAGRAAQLEACAEEGIFVDLGCGKLLEIDDLDDRHAGLGEQIGVDHLPVVGIGRRLLLQRMGVRPDHDRACLREKLRARAGQTGRLRHVADGIGPR